MALTTHYGQPSHLYSSTTVLTYQKGNCFDFSTLLCSLLIGSGYDAYCVNGYGSKDLCLMDLTRELCPLTIKPKEVGGAPHIPPLKLHDPVAPPHAPATGTQLHLHGVCISNHR